jgi:hypothetical protein
MLSSCTTGSWREIKIKLIPTMREIVEPQGAEGYAGLYLYCAPVFHHKVVLDFYIV